MPRVYYGWIMLFAIALMTFASSGSRFSFGVFVIPMSEELHWGRDQLALAASLNLILAGLQFLGRRLRFRLRFRRLSRRLFLDLTLLNLLGFPDFIEQPLAFSFLPLPRLS